ncbi:hypothetical protein [Serratia quinivorans]|uniref:hypothetical protein n=1 Tax=Serratia quinivorans TaxID=137545 RepID=UPI00217B9F8B|nr:hypothetical protein [Serratia quinivorans]CAI0861265.1 Uncharacterised protein [Serratia quinivorans]
MENTFTSEPATNTITLYRELFSQLDLHELTSTQLLDLAALSAEHIEGLCHGLILFGNLLRKEQKDNDWEQFARYLSSTAHLVSLLFDIYERSLSELDNSTH